MSDSEPAAAASAVEETTVEQFYDDVDPPVAEEASGVENEAEDEPVVSNGVTDAAPSLSPAPPSRKRARTEEAEGANGHSAATTSARYQAVPGEEPRTKLEPSIFGIAPLDEFTREVADWLASWLVEAKIGRLVTKGTNTRLQWPIVATETIITAPDQLNVMFESDMPIDTHKHYNQILNGRVDEQRDPSFSAPPIAYKHPLERDSFHATQGGDKLRVTYDQKTGAMKECVYKQRIANMEIYEPKHAFDIRISVSTETPMPKPSGQPTHERLKDRLSYTQQPFRIDLTQREPMRHELEVEVADMPNFQREAEMWHDPEKQDQSVFYELVHSFLGNVRMLVRNPP